MYTLFELLYIYKELCVLFGWIVTSGAEVFSVLCVMDGHVPPLILYINISADVQQLYKSSLLIYNVDLYINI